MNTKNGEFARPPRLSLWLSLTANSLYIPTGDDDGLQPADKKPAKAVLLCPRDAVRTMQLRTTNHRDFEICRGDRGGPCRPSAVLLPCCRIKRLRPRTQQSANGRRRVEPRGRVPGES